jgi:Rrf2 family protein
MPLLSQTAEYALRATTYLAQQPPDQAIDVGALATALAVPRNYLSKVLSQLCRAGILLSARGKGGGFSLARDPGAIALAELVAPFEPIDAEPRCLLGQASCSERHPCAVHRKWRLVNDLVRRFLRRTTLADLARGHTRWPGVSWGHATKARIGDGGGSRRVLGRNARLR